MRIVFAGTPAAAVPSLQALLDSPHEVVAVVTRPDARRGRGRSLARSEVGQLADEHGLPVLTPARASDPDFHAALVELAPDAAAIVAYGALLRQDILDVPTHGWVNLHFSLLPAWRGAAPVQHAILAGDEVTGASTFRLDVGMDTGPVFGVVTETIRPTDTSGDLLGRLSVSGAGLLVATLDGIGSGDVVAVPQGTENVSYAPKILVEHTRVDWTAPAMRIDRLIRAATPDPGAWTTFREDRIKLGPVTVAHPANATTGDDAEVPAAPPPGALRIERNAVLVGTATGAVSLGTVQPPGKRPMPAADWARGVRPDPSETFR